jgi:hypothetical protein
MWPPMGASLASKYTTASRSARQRGHVSKLGMAVSAGIDEQPLHHRMRDRAARPPGRPQSAAAAAQRAPCAM